MRSVLFCILVIPLVYGDISVSVNLKATANEFSEKLISNEVDFQKLLHSQGDFFVLAPSYLRIRNFVAHLRRSDEKAVTLAIFQALK
jgi:hypothetical protein